VSCRSALDPGAVLDLLDARCLVDARIHRHVVAARVGGDDAARRLADAAFAWQLVRFGNLTGEAAAELAEPDLRFDRLRAVIDEQDREQVRLHAAVADRTPR
jgi:hypothetical protein